MAYHVLKPWLHAVGNPGPLGLYAFGLSTAFLQVSCCNESLVKPVLLHALLQRVHRSWRAMHVSGQGRLHATLIILHCLGGPWRIMWAWRLALSCSIWLCRVALGLLVTVARDQWKVAGLQGAVTNITSPGPTKDMVACFAMFYGAQPLLPSLHACPV